MNCNQDLPKKTLYQILLVFIDEFARKACIKCGKVNVIDRNVSYLNI